MPLFRCELCGSMDNSGLSPAYWSAAVKKCTECATGTWHERFPKVPYDEQLHSPEAQERRAAEARKAI